MADDGTGKGLGMKHRNRRRSQHRIPKGWRTSMRRVARNSEGSEPAHMREGMAELASLGVVIVNKAGS